MFILFKDILKISILLLEQACFILTLLKIEKVLNKALIFKLEKKTNMFIVQSTSWVGPHSKLNFNSCITNFL